MEPDHSAGRAVKNDRRQSVSVVVVCQSVGGRPRSEVPRRPPCFKAWSVFLDRGRVPTGRIAKHLLPAVFIGLTLFPREQFRLESKARCNAITDHRVI